jgi:hypothetical protein
MATLQMVVDPLLNLLEIHRSKEKVPPTSSIKVSRTELMKVLERAASDDNFIAQLTYYGSKALRDYNLSSEEKAALLSGDIQWIERNTGTLDERLRTWLWCRLQQEAW